VADQPFRSSPRGFRDKAFFWFTRKPLAPLVVFTDDPQFPLLADDALPPPRRSLEADVVVHSTLADESLTIDTNRIGHPLLVKISYHPRWHAEGADGPYLVSPALMLIVPRQNHVLLQYGPDRSDALGRGLALAALLVIPLGPVFRRLRPPRPVASPAPVLAGCPTEPPPRRWGGLLPGLALGLCLVVRLRPASADHARDAASLAEKARHALEAGHLADAAEYARAGLFLRPADAVRQGLLVTRGEALLSQDPTAAGAAFGEVTRATGPLLAEALLGAYHAGNLSGDLAAAGIARERLLREFGGTPFAQELRKELKGTPEGGP
jgi:hypothetical protein